MFDFHDDQKEIDRLFPYLLEYQKIASKHNIADIFQDNGGKYLELQVLLGLKTSGKRQGNDAFDENKVEYEIKTVNLDKKEAFTTHHHLAPVIIEKYKRVDWYFAVYKGISLQRIYFMHSQNLYSYFDYWQGRLREEKLTHINNPTIPLSHVMQHGLLVWPPDLSGGATPVSERRKRAEQMLQQEIQSQNIDPLFDLNPEQGSSVAKQTSFDLGGDDATN